MSNLGSPKSKPLPPNGLSPIINKSPTQPISHAQQSLITNTNNTNTKSTASSLSSCSNSPSSVRINQNYDPNNLEHQSQKSPLQKSSNTTNLILGNLNNNTIPSTTGHASDDTNHRDIDLDNLEDADSKPLLDQTNTNCTIVSNNKRANEQYRDDVNGTDITESETLINNCN